VLTKHRARLPTPPARRPAAKAQGDLHAGRSHHPAAPIHWQAIPSWPSLDVSEVDYLIDGKQLWVEHNAPYSYGDDGNYLVTSFLKPGKHVFTMRAIDLENQTATDSVTVTVPPAPSPPAAPADTWKAWQPAGGAPSGYASLVISSVGWYEGQFPSHIPTATWRTWHTFLPGWWKSGPHGHWPRHGRRGAQRQRSQRVVQQRARVTGPLPVVRDRNPPPLHLRGRPPLPRLHQVPDRLLDPSGSLSRTELASGEGMR
jgi:hypothetical protein